MHFVADGLGEVVDHLRVGQVLALGGGRHHQVVLHQPDDQSGVPVAADDDECAEGFGIDRAQFRVIAAAALADVVVQPGEINQLGLGQLWP